MDKIKILVVDDESRMRKLVKDFPCPGGIYYALKPETVWKQWTCFMRKRTLRL